jgi:hypothetical protein
MIQTQRFQSLGRRIFSNSEMNSPEVEKICQMDNQAEELLKKAIEECEVYIYNIDQTEISDIDFGIETIQKPFEDNKVFILVSDVMVWSNTPKKIKVEAPPPPV